jgi:hypothetical protein
MKRNDLIYIVANENGNLVVNCCGSQMHDTRMWDVGLCCLSNNWFYVQDVRKVEITFEPRCPSR